MHKPVPPFPYTIVPVRADFLVNARVRGVDDLGQPVQRLVAKGGEPCRDALRRARSGEPLILASYCPFQHAGPYREYGPVFILADQEGGAVPARLPVDGGAPYLGDSFVLRAYARNERIVDALVSQPDQATLHLARLFAREDTAFVLARFTAYGCYAMRLAPLAPQVTMAG